MPVSRPSFDLKMDCSKYSRPFRSYHNKSGCNPSRVAIIGSPSLILLMKEWLFGWKFMPSNCPIVYSNRGKTSLDRIGWGKKKKKKSKKCQEKERDAGFDCCAVCVPASFRSVRSGRRRCNWLVTELYSLSLALIIVPLVLEFATPSPIDSILVYTV